MRLTAKLFRIQSLHKLQEVPQISLSHRILNSLEINPESVAIIDGMSGKTTTRGQLADQILSCAGWLTNNMDRGDVVGVSLPNTPAYLVPSLAAVHCGGAAALLNPIYTGSEVEHALSVAQPRVVFTSPLSLDTLRNAEGGDKVSEYVVLGGDIAGTTSFSTILGADKFTHGVPMADFEDTALMPFSSGTTGLPKVVCLSHKNCVTYSYMTDHHTFSDMGPESNMLCLLPMFHCYGFTMALHCITRQCRFTTMPKFELEPLLKAVQTHKISHLPIVPPIAAVLAKHPMIDDYDLTSCKDILCAAAPLSPQIQKVLAERLQIKTFRNGYGMSEIVAAGICPPPAQADHIMRKGSIGLVMPGIEARVVDVESRADLGPNQEGEILFKGDSVMKGYLGNPGATAASVDETGWLHTGDIGKYDEDHLFYITDRLKELIKYKGWQVAPAELEDTILTHPLVADVGVIGVAAPEDGDGEVPKAFVVLKPDVPANADTVAAIEQLVEDQLTSYKRLRGGVVFVEALPRSLAGKLLRRELRKL